MTTTDDNEHLQALLEVHRRNLAHLLVQAAAYGGEQYTPLAVANCIYDARQNIARIKNTLRRRNVVVANHPDDESASLLSKRRNQKIARRNTLPPDTTPSPVPLPPEFATYMLWYLPMDREIREAVIGDLDEEFSILYDRFGRRKAVIWYYCQVGASFWPFVKAKVQQAVKLGVLM
jgi:hypothetical protein